MPDRTITKEITLLLVIMAVFLSVLAGLKVYDNKTGKIRELGTKIVSRYI